MITQISPVLQAFVEYGVTLTILSAVLLLLFSYFKKLIGQKSLLERLFDTVGTILIEIHRVKEDLVAIKAILRGNFRTRGRDDD